MCRHHPHLDVAGPKQRQQSQTLIPIPGLQLLNNSLHPSIQTIVARRLKKPTRLALPAVMALNCSTKPGVGRLR
jgi:hypothetical protein